MNKYLEALRLLDNLATQIEKAQTGLDNYEPSPTQKEFHCSLAKERVLLGANKSGKSHAGAIETCWHLTGKYPDWYPEEGKIKPNAISPRDIKIVINVETLDKVKDNIIPYLNKFLKGILDIKWIKNGPQQYVVAGEAENGAIIKFVSNRMKTEALEGGEADFFWSDEPPTQEHYTALLRAFLKQENRLIITATSLKYGWMTAHFLDPPLDLKTSREKLGAWAVPWVKSMPLSENTHYKDEEKAYWEASLKSVSLEEAQARLEGIPFQTIGRVFGQDFIPSKHIYPIPAKPFNSSDFCLYYSLDPHDKKGPAMLWIAVRRPDKTGHSQKIVVYSHYDEYKFMTPKDIVSFIKEVEKDRLNGIFDDPPPVITRYIDPRFSEHTQVTGQKYKELLLQAGVDLDYPVVFQKAEGGISAGHSAIRDMLRNEIKVEDDVQPELIVLSNCTPLIEALKFYSYKYGEEGVEEKYKDLIDCLRYAVSGGLWFYDTKNEDNFTARLNEFLS